MPSITKAELVSNTPKTDRTVTAIPIATPIPFKAVSTITSKLPSDIQIGVRTFGDKQKETNKKTLAKTNETKI